MTRLPGDKPDRQRNFHGARGEHLFPHPETYEPRRSRWNAWEKRYAAHLDAHRQQATDPSPLPGDGEAVLALFAHIERQEKIIAKEKLLIVALRQRAAQAPDDMAEVDARVRRTLAAGGMPTGDDLDGE